MKKWIYVLMLSLLCFPAIADENVAFDSWKKNFEQQVFKANITTATLNTYFKNVRFLPSVVEADRKQPEFTLSFGRYMKKAVSPERVAMAQELFKKHNHLLVQMEIKYHVPATYLLAFWGLETNFGTNKGKIPVLSALATLSFDERRSDFFAEQLIAMLKILQKEKTPEPFGSWAGAFGHFQFMPTTFYQYAVDENKNGQIDVYNEFEDAIGSAANYLSKMGWTPNLKWGRPVLLTNPKAAFYSGDAYPIEFWAKQGVLKTNKEAFNPSEYQIKAKLLLPEGVNGPAFLTYKNFDIIKRWNNSDFYALAIGLLSDKIGHLPSLDTQNMKQTDPLSTSEIKMLQEALICKKLYQGKADGKLGSATRAAVKNYQKQNNLIPDGFLSKELLEKIIK